MEMEREVIDGLEFDMYDVAKADSHVQKVGYNAEAKTLAVRFKSRGDSGPSPTYFYLGVPEILAKTLRTDPSPGGVLNRDIKPMYLYRKVEG